MSAIFDFSSLLTVILFLICTCAYLRDMRPTIFDGGQVRLLLIVLNKLYTEEIGDNKSLVCNQYFHRSSKKNGHVIYPLLI